MSNVLLRNYMEMVVTLYEVSRQLPDPLKSEKKSTIPKKFAQILGTLNNILDQRWSRSLEESNYVQGYSK